MQFLIESATPELSEYVTEFCQFVYDKLGIITPPSITFVERTGQASFGNYRPSTGAIVVAIEGRHMCDIFRTIAHEIVHAKQMEDGTIDSTPLLQLEAEANAIAGLLLRDANKEHPEWYGVEEALPDDQLDQEGESQGAMDADTTRPSGPINMAEAKIQETDSDRLKMLKLQNQALRAFPSSPRQQAIQKQIEMLRSKMKREGSSEYHTTLKEDMTAGAGDIAGLGVGPQGEPGAQKKRPSPILQPMLKRFKRLREEHKDSAYEARKKLASGKIPASAEDLLARRKLVDQINAPKKIK